MKIAPTHGYSNKNKGGPFRKERAALGIHITQEEYYLSV